MDSGASPLRVVVADGKAARLQEVTDAVVSLGHDVVPREIDLTTIGPLTTAERPNVAVVIVGDNSDQALGRSEGSSTRRLAR